MYQKSRANIEIKQNSKSLRINRAKNGAKESCIN